MARRLFVWFLGWFLGCVLCACGSEAPRPPTRLRLWCDGQAEWLETSPPAASRTVFAPRFETDLEGWESVVNPGREPGEFEAHSASEDGQALVRLRGAHGGLDTVVPVEPDTCYVFTGRVRASALAADAADFDGARFWLAEASDQAPFVEFRTTRKDLMTGNWTSPTALGHAGWRPIRRVFVTQPRTRFLHVLCSLAAQSSVRAGSVEFSDLRLEASSRAGYWREVVTQQSRRRDEIDASPAHAGRRVSAQLGLENRPGLVLLPGERLRFSLPDLADGARLAFGAGIYRPTLLERNGGEARLRVRAGGQTLLERPFEVPLSAAGGDWESLEVQLTGGPALPRANGATELEFTLEGDSPLVLGAPLVLTGAPPRTSPNVLLISIDTLRADRVGAYGYAGTTPNLDRLAGSGLLCRDASAVAPYTLPAHATLLTGQFPLVHGVVASERTLSAARSTPLAEILARAGYTTQAFTAGGFVNSEFGLDRGFEGFSHVDPIRAGDSHAFRTLAARVGPAEASRLFEEHGFNGVERWLRAHARERFFLFLHTYTVHDYDPPPSFLACKEKGCSRPKVPLSTRTRAEAEAFTPEMRAHIQHLYDAALRYTDERLGRLFALLAELGLAHDTLILVTSDHGEEFFEHGALQHGRTLYEELLRIPLILAGPGIAARVLERPAMQVDVVPTLLARLGLPCPEHVQGVDLLGRDWPARALWSEVDDRFAHKYALREERGAKAIHGPATSAVRFPNEQEWEHYDLARDPLERHALAGPPPPERAADRRKLEQQRAALEALGNSLGASAQGELGASTLEQLDELGYGGE